LPKKIPPFTESAAAAPKAFSSWLEISIICKGYLERQKLRVGEESRIHKLEFHALKQRPELIEIKKIDERGQVVEWEKKEDRKEEAEEYLKNTVYSTFAYKATYELAQSLRKDEKHALSNAMELVKMSEVWNWCERTKGLGEVAGMTALAFINPEICTTAGKTKAILGLRPGANLKKGERANYNPHAKGRFSLLTRNVIMQQDIYYSNIYNVKKEYYTQRPDFVLKLEEEKEWMKTHDKSQGIKKWIDNKARMYVTQLLASHATEIIQNELGRQIPRHRNYLPPRPADPRDCLRIVDMFREQTVLDLQMITKRLVEAGMPQLEEQIDRLKQSMTKGGSSVELEALEEKREQLFRQAIDQLRRDRGET
jgi:hypothetical protein